MDAASPALTLPASLAGFGKVEDRKNGAIQKTRYSHESMIDQIIANPWVTQGELARIYGYTEGWVSQVISSDAFQAKLAERKDQIIDPTLRATVEERFKALAHQSLRRLLNLLGDESKTLDPEVALRAAEIAAKALGMGPTKQSVTVQQNFVVAVPGKSASSDAWMREHGAGAVVNSPAGRTLEAPASETAVLVEPGSAAPINTIELLKSLKGGG